MLQLDQRTKHPLRAAAVEVGDKGLNDKVGLVRRSHLRHCFGISWHHGHERMILSIEEQPQRINGVCLDTQIRLNEQESDERVGERRSAFLDGAGDVASHHDRIVVDHR